MTFRSKNIDPYVADAIEDGSPVADDVYSISEIRVVETIGANDTETGLPEHRVTFTATLETRTDENGLPTFRDERLYIGRQIRFDLGTTIVDGVVIDMEPVQG
jgi:hypothetical protein